MKIYRAIFKLGSVYHLGEIVELVVQQKRIPMYSVSTVICVGMMDGPWVT